MTVNERMFKIMNEKNIKAIELSNKLGLAKSVISNWKNRGNDPAATFIEPIAELLGVSITYLITGKESEELTEEEQELLRIFRMASRSDKDAAMRVLASEEKTEKSSDSKIG